MKCSVGRPRTRASARRNASQIAVLLFSTMILFSCSAPIIISGQDLSPEQQSVLLARRGITIKKIGVEPTDGRLFVLAPGIYPIEFKATHDLESADRSMASVLNVMECSLEIEFMAGEEVQLSGKVRTGSFDSSAGYSEKGFHTEISLKSSIEGRSSTIDTSECESWIDCDHIDRTRMMPITCK